MLSNVLVQRTPDQFALRVMGHGGAIFVLV